MKRQIGEQSDGRMHRQRQTDGRTDRQTDRQRDGQTEGQTGRQTDRNVDGDGLPRAPAGDHFPVVTAAVDEHVASHAVAPLSGEALRRVALLRGRLVALHGQVVAGHLQLAVRGLGIQLKRLT